MSIANRSTNFLALLDIVLSLVASKRANISDPFSITGPQITRRSRPLENFPDSSFFRNVTDVPLGLKKLRDLLSKAPISRLACNKMLDGFVLRTFEDFQFGESTVDLALPLANSLQPLLEH